MIHYDVVILGGGAAGLMCAIEAGKRGQRVLVIERSEKVIRQIEYTVINIAALLGALYFLIDHLQRVLDYLPNVKH